VFVDGGGDDDAVVVVDDDEKKKPSADTVAVHSLEFVCRARWRSAPADEVVAVDLHACACCHVFTTLAAFVDGNACAEHEPAAFDRIVGGSLLAIELLTRDGELDPFTLANMIEATHSLGGDDDDDDESAATHVECSCRSFVSRHDATSSISRVMRIAVVRLRWTTGIVDVFASALRTCSTHESCPAYLVVESPLLNERYDFCAIERTRLARLGDSLAVGGDAAAAAPASRVSFTQL
jgi:hypothetical protein